MAPRIYTKTGDDGTTGLYFGGRVRKDDAAPRAYGTVDEAQAAIGLARAEAAPGGELDALLVQLCRDLYVCMAELATLPENRHKLSPGTTAVSDEMVASLEPRIDDLIARFEMPSDFVVPGANRASAALDVARTVVRRAERESLAVAAPGSHVVRYLNRLSDLLWALARWQEGEHVLSKRSEQ
ncbi:MAG: cob(I)yrinic acid a,c-diamide adenosyltransferase [Acidobacteria bacterium]|nr:cob(I)yrinic acid a,c-diamide adenosyltransferase [Acidobacteriota bacterium]